MLGVFFSSSPWVGLPLCKVSCLLHKLNDSGGYLVFAALLIRRVVLTVLSSFLRQSYLVVTNVTSALEVVFKRYALDKSTFYLLNYLY